MFDIKSEEFSKVFYEKLTIAKSRSYSPYSHYPVGACLYLKDGSFILGTNIENASFGLCNCAERSALFSCYSQGYKKEDILCLGIIANCPKGKYASPCGACRQVISELMDNKASIFLYDQDGNYIVTDIDNLLPGMFSEGDLI